MATSLLPDAARITGPKADETRGRTVKELEHDNEFSIRRIQTLTLDQQVWIQDH